MKLTMSDGKVLNLPGCLARFGAHFGIIGSGYEVTHEIKQGKIWQVLGPAGCQRQLLGTVETIEA
jgi:hypothetical protein